MGLNGARGPKKKYTKLTQVTVSNTVNIFKAVNYEVLGGLQIQKDILMHWVIL